ncbi:MAG: lysophospholipase [Lachnospiraceae bacterium]|nr:lysophospholipase [Lachnospiraceae bacterium]
MTKTEFTIDSRDGVTKLHAVRWTPDGEVKGIIQIVHGMAEYVERYEHAAKWFSDRGFVVTGVDMLGHGKSVPEGGTYGYYCEQDPATVVVRDVHRLKKQNQEQFPGVPYFIWGHSMGSFILRNYMFRYGTGIDGAIVCGTGSQPGAVVKFGLCLTSIQKLFFGSKHKAQMIANMAFGDPKKIPEGHKSDWLCTDPAETKKYDEDPLCGFVFTVNGYKTLFTLIDRLNNKKLVSKMPKDLPVFIISGSEDTVGDNGKGVKQVYESYKELGMKDVEMKLYEGYRHEIHNEPIKEEVFSDMLGWIERKIK